MKLMGVPVLDRILLLRANQSSHFIPLNTSDSLGRNSDAVPRSNSVEK